MKIRLALATATAMGLLMGAAAAGSNNKTYIDQSGANNQASITQSAGSSNEAGADGLAIRQVRNGLNLSPGLRNVLTIDQSGTGNKVGLQSNGNAFGNNGVYQEMGYDYGVGNNGYVGQNVIDIKQTSNNNTIGAASQVSRTHWGGNSLTVVQGGQGNNTVGSVSQRRTQTTRNIAEIEQQGQYNTISRVEQTVIQAASAANESNVIKVEITGDNNGGAGFTLGGAAAVSGAQSSVLSQVSDISGTVGNSIDLFISGNGNEFGVTQRGGRNSVGQLTVSGNDNELGIYQDGKFNVVSVGALEGDENNVGVRQIGTNTATVNVFGVDSDGNKVGVSQEGTNTATANVTGSTNDVTLVQGYNGGVGGVNTASLTVTGDSNRLNARQLGSNTMTVNVTGSFNNNTGGGFTLAAAGAAGSLNPGDLFQTGSNTATITVGNTNPASNSNLFAFNQNGAGNTLTGTINGSNNQAAVVQNGNTNVASFVQNGGMNQLGVSQ